MQTEKLSRTGCFWAVGRRLTQAVSGKVHGVRAERALRVVLLLM